MRNALKLGVAWVGIAALTPPYALLGAWDNSIFRERP
jgi:hypothetical protein